MKYVKVEDYQYESVFYQFLEGVIKLYTKKNHIEFIELHNIADVKRYRNRLYFKELLIRS